MRTHTWARMAVAGVMVAAVGAAPEAAFGHRRFGGMAEDASHHDPLTLPKGTFELELGVHASISSGAEWRPVNITPAIYYGVTDRFTVGITHQPYPFLGLFGGPGICFRGCGDTYDNVSAEALFHTLDLGPVSLAAIAAVDVERFDPFGINVRGGFRARLHQRYWSISIEPTVSAGEDTGVVLPAWVTYHAVPWLAVSLHGAMLFDIDAVFDQKEDLDLAFGASVVWSPVPAFDVGAMLHFVDDFRSLSLTAAFRL